MKEIDINIEKGKKKNTKRKKKKKDRKAALELGVGVAPVAEAAGQFGLDGQRRDADAATELAGAVPAAALDAVLGATPGVGVGAQLAAPRRRRRALVAQRHLQIPAFQKFLKIKKKRTEFHQFSIQLCPN